MFRVKICGIRKCEDAEALAGLGVDAAGLNFFPQSKRFISQEEATKIRNRLPSDVQAVGLFVNASIEQMNTAFRELRLDWLQLHGDEPPEVLLSLPSNQVIKAFRVDHRGLEPVIDYLKRANSLGRPLAGVLLDSASTGAMGGTGVIADWEGIARDKIRLGLTPLILAGGLTPWNVAEAIRAVRPYAVDAASGVESADGFKDAAKVREFAQIAAHELTLH